MSQQEIKRVWIEEGCISCNLCAEICAEVFEVPEGMDCVIKPGAATHFASKAEEIIQSTEDWPVEVMKDAWE